MMERRLLAISWTMPPIVLPRSMQVSRNLKHLAERGWHSTVITVDPRSLSRKINLDPALEAACWDAFDCVRVPSWENALALRVLWHFFPGLALRPDPKIVWVRPAVRAALAVQTRQPQDLLVSFAHPLSDHLIGLRLKQATGLPWVAHFSDPWVDHPFARPLDPQTDRIRRKMEADVISAADAVIFVTGQTADVVMRKYPPEWRQKIFVVPHGYEAQPLEPAAANPCLRLVYTGTFYGNRTPAGLLHGLAQLQSRIPLAGQIEILLVGSRTEEYRGMARELHVDTLVQFAPAVSFTESQRLANQADVLLLIDAPNDRGSMFLPSKLVDYLIFRKPILGLTPQEGASADLLRRLECTVINPDDADAIANALAGLIELRRAGALGISPAFEQTALQYDARQTTLALENVLLQTIARAGH